MGSTNLRIMRNFSVKMMSLITKMHNGIRILCNIILPRLPLIKLAFRIGLLLVSFFVIFSVVRDLKRTRAVSTL